jgi:hypothetical protein
VVAGSRANGRRPGGRVTDREIRHDYGLNHGLQRNCLHEFQQISRSAADIPSANRRSGVFAVAG